MAKVREITHHLILVRFGHWCCSNFHVKFLPHLRHVTNWLRAKGASKSARWDHTVVHITAQFIQTTMNENTQHGNQSTHWQCSCISSKHFLWIVCPHGNTVTSFLDSNKYCKPKQTISLQGNPVSRCWSIQNARKELVGVPYLKANRTVMMHCPFNTRMTIFQDHWVATTAFVTVEEIFSPSNSVQSQNFVISKHKDNHHSAQ